MNILELAKESGLIDAIDDHWLECGYYKPALQAFAQAVIEDYRAGLVPVAHIDIAKRKVILDDTVVFKTPTIAVMDDIPLYALPSGETK